MVTLRHLVFGCFRFIDLMLNRDSGLFDVKEVLLDSLRLNTAALIDFFEHVNIDSRGGFPRAVLSNTGSHNDS